MLFPAVFVFAVLFPSVVVFCVTVVVDETSKADKLTITVSGADNLLNSKVATLTKDALGNWSVTTTVTVK